MLVCIYDGIYFKIDLDVSKEYIITTFTGNEVNVYGSFIYPKTQPSSDHKNWHINTTKDALEKLINNKIFQHNFNKKLEE